MAFFVTFEGIDGCGKTTAVAAVASFLAQQHIPHICTREPGGAAFSEAMRELLLTHPEAPTLDPYTQALCMTAARIEHVHRTILPALEEKKWVLCDRFIDSTTAYQGYAQGVPLSWLHNLHSAVPIEPDLTFVLDIDASTAQNRLRNRQEASSSAANTTNHLDKKPEDFYTKAAQGFKEIAAQKPARYVNIDARQSMAGVKKEVVHTIKSKLLD